MNKQDLIEKAVINFDGEMPKSADVLLTTGSNWKHSKNVAGKVLPAIKIDGYHGYEWHEKGDSYPMISDESWVVLCTREEFNAATDRMRLKPDWSELPAKAEWLAQDRCGTWKPMQGRKPTIEEGSYWITDHHFQPQPRGTVIGDWRNTLEKRPEQKVETMGEAISIAMTNAASKMASDLRDLANAKAPAKPWFEAGELPPVGAECEYLGCAKKWDKCKIVFTSEYVVVIEGEAALNELVQIAFNFGDWPKFRQIKTDKEKAIEAADSAIHDYLAGAEIRTELLGALYDAGLLRLPDNKKPD